MATPLSRLIDTSHARFPYCRRDVTTVEIDGLVARPVPPLMTLEILSGQELVTVQEAMQQNTSVGVAGSGDVVTIGVAVWRCGSVAARWCRRNGCARLPR